MSLCDIPALYAYMRTGVAVSETRPPSHLSVQSPLMEKENNNQCISTANRYIMAVDNQSAGYDWKPGVFGGSSSHPIQVSKNRYTVFL